MIVAIASGKGGTGKTSLAVNLARHSANDWHNPALPDDFSAIERLLHIDRETLLGRLGLPDDLTQKYLALPNRLPFDGV